MAGDLDDLFSQFQLTETVRIDAPPSRVWELIADIERIVEFSPECIKVEWLDGATGPVVGARFAGASRAGAFEWTRNCTITRSEAPVAFAYEVYDEADAAPQSRWAFEISPDGTGAVLTQRFSHVPTGRSTIRLMAEGDPDEAQQTIDERAHMLARDMRRTLEAMRAILEGSA